MFAAVSEITRSEITALIADDEAANAKLLERILTGGGFGRVIVTTDSREVARLCREEDPGLIMLDLAMPKPDGFELLESLRGEERNATATIVMLTGHEHPSIERRALALGAQAVVGKTESRDELLARIDAALAENRP